MSHLKYHHIFIVIETVDLILIHSVILSSVLSSLISDCETDTVGVEEGLAERCKTTGTRSLYLASAMTHAMYKSVYKLTDHLKVADCRKGNVHVHSLYTFTAFKLFNSSQRMAFKICVYMSFNQ